MIRSSNSLALLKVLIAAAWADSQLSQTELNYIKELARRFRLDDEEWFTLQPYLEDPPTDEETDLILSDLQTRVGSAAERKAITEHIEAVIQADDTMSEEEQEFLQKYEDVFSNTSSLDLLVARIRGLVRAAPNESRIDVDEFMRNKILYKLRRRIGDDQITPEMHRLALVGGLMGIVAQADGEIDERELEAIRGELSRLGQFEPDTLDVLLAIIREESVRGLDRYRLIAEYADGSAVRERRDLLDLLFLVAAADGALTHAELEELRSISSALHLSHKQYIDAKVSALDK